jgi:hypothetical protein
VSSGVLLFVQRRTVLICCGLALSVLALYGPMIGSSDHNGIRYLVGPFVCPTVAAIYFTIFPFRPYRGSPFTRTESRDIGAEDPAVIRLVEIYKLPAARRFIWLAAFKMSCVLFVIMSICTILVRESLNWKLDSRWLWPGVIGGCLFSWVAMAFAYIGWGLGNWASREPG